MSRIIIVVVSVSAQNNSTEQQSSQAGSNGTATGGNITSITAAAGTKVSIIEEASEMGDQAYDPNPVKVKSGDTVMWTNDDSQIHTVTSGTDSSDPNMGKEFDSFMLSQNVLPQIRYCRRLSLLLSIASNNGRKGCCIIGDQI
jgi:plastocyanin